MKSIFLVALSGLAALSCSSNSTVVSQKYIHKYGFDITKDEWQERESEGKVVTLLENGVKLTESFENGHRHGASSYTYPHSTAIEKLCIYDQGTLIKEVLHDRKGIPMQETAYEFDNRKVVTIWDQNGSPLSVEEYESDHLMEGTYYNTIGDIESTVESGNGLRVKRDRTGKILLKDKMEASSLVQRTAYHPNEQVESISNYENYQLHGDQQIFAPSGRLHMKAHWNQGTLDGLKSCYREGKLFLETNFVNGKKEGIEKRFDEDGNLVQEMNYAEDLKHGPCTVYDGRQVKTEWYYSGRKVNSESHTIEPSSRGRMVDMNSGMIADMTQERN
jgi:antitoxin component YwqK of YwqJK toxin-antitoxin module